jgi:hypothetical protein
MDVPDHPRDITLGVLPIGEHPRPFIEQARTDHQHVSSSYLYVDVPPDGRKRLRVMVSTQSMRGRRHVEVGELYPGDRTRLVRYLAALEPDAAAQGIDDVRRVRERERVEQMNRGT